MSRRLLLLLLLLPVAIAAWVRLWHIGGQIPLDDEWHAIAYVLGRDLSSLLTRFSRLGANSVPQNLYLWLAAETVGLSEWSIALPSLVTGTLVGWTFARFTQARLGLVAALVAGTVLALSPVLVFFGRFARPYAPVLWLEALALAALADWLRSGERRDRTRAVGFGVLAMWVHATAIAPLLAAWLAAGLWQWRRQPRPAGEPGPRHVAKAGGVLAVLGGSLLLYWYGRQVNPAMAADAAFSWRTLTGLVPLVCGSTSRVVQVIVLGAGAGGMVLAARRAPREVLVLTAAAIGATVVVLVGHPLQAEIPAIFVRYALPVFLVLALAVGAAAQGLADLGRRAWQRRAAATVLCFGFAALSYFLGPLPGTFASPNNFTKHPAYLLGGTPPDPTHARPDPYARAGRPGLDRAQLQPIYAALARVPDTTPIIEYPFILGRNFNLFYFAQELHRRPVLAGYYDSGAQDDDYYGLMLGPRPPAAQRPRASGFILDVYTVDHVLGRAAPAGPAHFATMVDILDAEAVRQSGAGYLILHGNLLREFLAEGPTVGRSGFVTAILPTLSARYGPPLFENPLVTVFRLTPLPAKPR